MISYSIYKYFCNNKKKWLFSILVLTIVAILLRYIVSDDFLQNGQPLTFYDYIFSSMSYPFVIMLIIPLLYCYLASDIIINDFSGKYINFLITRTPNRSLYFISKVITVFFSSNLLLICYFSVLVFVGFIFHLPINEEYYYYTLVYALNSGKSILSLLVINYGLLLISLISLGTFLITISLLFNKSIYNYIAVILLIVQSHNSVFNNNSKIMFSPIAQSILSLHYPFNNGNTLTNYTVSHSINYMFILFFLFFFIGYLKIRTTNLSLKE